MSEAFDPYRIWLSIPPEVRPPSHYELLGISPSEREPAVIKAAAMRQSGYVRNFQVGKHSKDATRILNEIGEALACLQDPVKRAAYDAERQAQAAPRELPLARPVATPAPLADIDRLAAAAAPLPRGRTVRTQRRPTPVLLGRTSKPKPLSTVWYLAVAVAASVAVAAVTIALHLGGQESPPEEIAAYSDATDPAKRETSAPESDSSVERPRDALNSPPAQAVAAPAEIAGNEDQAEDLGAPQSAAPADSKSAAEAATGAATTADIERVASDVLAGAVSYYRADGDASDSKGAVHGTLNGSVKFVPGVAGKAFRFDGGDGNVLFKGPFIFHRTGDASLTFCMRFSPASKGHFALVWGRADSRDASGFHLYLDTGGLLGLDYGSPSGSFHPLFSQVTVGTGEFFNVAIVRAADSYSLFVDGRKLATATDAMPALPTSNEWRLSGRPGCQFVGEVDEIATFDRALSSAEVESISRYRVAQRDAVVLQEETAANGLLAQAVAWYRAEGNADDSAGKHHGKLSGGAAIKPVAAGHAFDFDGKTGSVIVPDALDLNPPQQFSVMAWVKPATTAHCAIISKISGSAPQGNAGYQFGIGPENASLFVQFNAPGEPWPANSLAVNLPNPMAVGAWRHVAGSYDGNSLKLYLDGIPIGSKEVGAKPIASSNANFRISGDDNGVVHFSGLIDDAAFFNRGLRDSKIETVYRGGAWRTATDRPSLGGLSEGQKAYLASHANAGTIDVLELIDPARDARSGSWRRDSRGLYSPANTMHAFLRLPVATPAEYMLDLVVEPGASSHLMMTLLNGMTQFQALVGNEINGLQYIDGAWWNSNETSVREGLFTKDTDCTVTCVVRQAETEVYFNGRRIIHWRGDRSRLTPYGDSSSPLRLMLGTHDMHLFKAIRLTPLSEARTEFDTSQQPAVDLLKTVDLKRHAVRGPWAFEGPVLVAPPGFGHGILRVPGAFPDEYALRIVCELPRDHQGGHEFAFGLVAPPSQVHVVLDSGGLSGFETIDGKAAAENETTFRGQLFVPGVESTIDCFVRKQGIRIDFDGRTIIDWKGDRRSLASAWVKTAGAPKRNFYFGTHHKFFIKRLELLPLKEFSTPPGGWPVPTKAIDVLKLIRPERDAVKGRWSVADGSLSSAAGESLSCIRLPVGVPDEYSLTIEATLQTGDPTVHIGLVSGGAHCLMIVDGNRLSGLDLIDGLRFDANPTRTDVAHFRPNAKAVIECTVRKSGIRVTFDGQPIVDYQGDPSRLSVLPLWPGRAMDGLFISTHDAYRLDRIELAPLPPETKADGAARP